MKRTYRFFDKEDYKGRKVTFDYPQPFYENMDADFRSIYGEDLYFIKELNHRDKIVRLHNAYDSGKGTRYVAPLVKPRKKRRLNFELRIKEIFDSNLVEQKTTLKVESELEYEGEATFFLFRKDLIYVFTRASRAENGSVAGYRNVIDFTPNAVRNYLKVRNYYPELFAWYD